MSWQDREVNRRPPRRAGGRDDDDFEADEFADDPEAPDPSDQDDHDDPELIPCPHCHKRIVEESEWCPHCGEWVERERAERPWWVWVGIVLAVVMAAMWAIGR